MTKYQKILVLIVLTAVQAACILPAFIEARRGGSVDVTAEPSGVSGGAPVGEPTAYPQTAEEVVRSFLAASQSDPMSMVQYLTPQQQEALPPEGPLPLLKIDAPIAGFSIDAAAVNPEPPGAAQVHVSIEAGGEKHTRTFFLTLVNGYWFINLIE